MEANDIRLSKRSKNIISRESIRALIQGGTHLLSCWSTRAAQQKLAKGRRLVINVNLSMYEQIQSILKLLPLFTYLLEIETKVWYNSSI